MPACPVCQKPLPEPPERFCPNCGADLEALPAIPTPALGAPAAGPSPRAAGSTPWEDRARLGFVPALFETTKEVLTAPAEFFRRMPVTGGFGAPLGYGVLIGYVGLLVQALYQALFNMVGGMALVGLAENRGFDQALPVLHGGIGFVFQAVFGPLFLLVGIFVASGIYHLVLLLLGGAQRGFEATLRAVCYSQATAVISILPICGWLLGIVWYLVVATIALSEAHGIGRGTAAVAVLLPFLLLCCCCAVAFFLVFGSLAGLAGMAQPR